MIIGSKLDRVNRPYQERPLRLKRQALPQSQSIQTEISSSAVSSDGNSGADEDHSKINKSDADDSLNKKEEH